MLGRLYVYLARATFDLLYHGVAANHHGYAPF
jgi:hypothetical protein